MPFAFFLAFRYLRTPRINRLAQFTALAAIIGIACGVAAMIVANSLANGFRAAMQNKILANTAHITVFSADGADLSDWQIIERQLEQIESVESVSATTFDNALLVGKTNSAFAVLRGVQSSKFKVQTLSSEVQSPKSKIQSLNFEDEKSKIQNLKSKIYVIYVEIGRDLAEKTGLSVGDTAEVITGNINVGETYAPLSATIEVNGIFATGLYEYDSTWIRLSLSDAAKITGRASDSVAALEIKTDDIYKSNETSKLIREKLGSGFKVLDWQEANRPLFAALNLERRVGVLIIVLIVLLAALNITTTLALVVNERKMDIAVLKTCGARAKSIVFIFLLEGALLGGIGILLGVLLGLTACYAANYFGWINLPPDVYSISSINLEPKLNEIFLTITTAFLLCLTASTFPAWAAARIKPSANLQKN